MTSSLKVTGSNNIDLNGCDITCVEETSEQACYPILAKENAELTLTGDGTVYANSSSAMYNIPVFASGDAVVTIESGDYVAGADADGETCHAVYAAGNAKVYIKGGTFSVEGKNSDDMSVIAVLNCQDKSNAQIILSGGKFKGFGPNEYGKVTSGSANQQEVVLAEGYRWSDAADSEGYWSVIKK